VAALARSRRFCCRTARATALRVGASRTMWTQGILLNAFTGHGARAGFLADR
jgi:hypothetical protein